MNDAEARRLIETTFNKPYDEARFRRLIVNLLEVEPRSEKQSGSYIYEAFRDYVTSYQRTGKFTDADGNELDTLAVKLKSARMLERNRTTQRNFVAEYLKRRGKDAALVAFYADDAEDWRFSLIKLEYTLTETKTGRLSAKTDLTPARRYSFLVGQHEPNHTAQKQLVTLLTHPNPTLRELEAQFSIENVTKAFFEEYKARYLELQETLDALLAENAAVRGEFAAKNIDTTTFAKRLLGQIVFLYFLQKKGWLGVGRGEAWGSGPKDFLQRLFKGDIIPYANFYDDVLEPLFYDALAREHTDNYSPHLKRRVPFLNGGLFEPINGYDWVNVDVPLPNTLFESVFRTFSTYNFTVREDEPLEREVAVDPEMLGKVFENLLEVTDRKSKGAFYTPREIVHYMCQESLINYLDTSLNTVKKPLAPSLPTQDDLFGAPQPRQESLYQEVYEEKVPRADLERFIRLGDASSEHDATTAQKERETAAYRFKASESVRDHAPKIDAALAAIKICDPAIGSGAFPVGMMNEIVRSRAALTPFLTGEARTLYDFKRHAIQESLYGVDVDESAVDIAKLRLWLSLVVDEDDFGTIKPLPNLEYKIVTGNSLLGVEETIFNNEVFEKLERLQHDYLNETRSSQKRSLKSQIEALISELTNDSERFDFKIYFSEVFRQKGGFDVVIGNPPYGIVFNTGLKTSYLERFPSFARNNDIYVAFYELGVEILGDMKGMIYITPNTFLNGDYFKKLRHYLSRKTKIHEIIDYKEVPVFADPTVFVSIFNAHKFTDIKFPYMAVIKIADETIEKFNVEAVLIEEPSDRPIKSSNLILERLNVSSNFTLADEMYYIKDVGFNYWTKGGGKKRGLDSIGKRVFYKGKQVHYLDIPFLKGKNIHRYFQSEPDNFLKHNYQEFLDSTVDTLRFSENFLKSTPKVIYRQTAHRPIATLDRHAHLLDKTAHLIVPKANHRTPNLRFLLGLLNSRLFHYLYKHISQEKEGRAFSQVKTTYIKKLPIRTIDFSNPAGKAAHDRMTGMVETMLELQGQKAAQKATASGDALAALEARITELDAAIDALVYELYGLTDEEIKIVEGAL